MQRWSTMFCSWYGLWLLFSTVPISLLKFLISFQSVSGFVPNLQRFSWIKLYSTQKSDIWIAKLLMEGITGEQKLLFYCQCIRQIVLFSPWNAWGKKWKWKERILYWILCRNLFTWSSYLKWSVSKYLNYFSETKYRQNRFRVQGSLQVQDFGHFSSTLKLHLLR